MMANYAINTTMEADDKRDIITVVTACSLCSYRFVAQVEIPFNDSGMEKITNSGALSARMATKWMLEHLASKHFMFGQSCNHTLKRS